MKQLSQFINEAKATYCGRCGTTHVSPAKGGTCPALKEEDLPWHEDPKNPTRKVGERKDQYGNVIKNTAKHLAKKAMKDMTTEEADKGIRLAKVMHKGKHVANVTTYRGRGGGWLSGAETPDGQNATKKYGIGMMDTKKEILQKIKQHHRTTSEETDLEENAKIVAHLQKRYGDNIRKSHVVSAANDFGVDASKLAKAVRTKLGKSMLGEEQIDEISKATLGSYTKKAARSTAGLAANAAARAALHGKASEYDKRTLRNRLTGISRATDRMTKEEVEDLDEVSAAKLRDYADKASDARGHRNLSTAKLDKRYKSMALAHEKIRARHAQVAATEETAKTLSQFIEEANNNLLEADQIKAHHERVKKLKGKKVSFTHPVSKQKITGTMQKIVQMGGLPYAHVETGKSAHRVPVHQID